MKRRTSDQMDEDENRMERAREKEEERDGREKNGRWKGYYLVEVKEEAKEV